ncbi:TraR/DksA family transcriptional regulator [Gephyromycinifex aptenodytis]|uniref:TraR/DksA family transcriptional regulator n=1 Tax=Gephyromycinifex aptenodytis TaxID=2716227 RepID=UPI0014470A83|nr:TraR/DksA C4-type zinc finger protein [Gephyromycinifex aptenodytis]
MGATADDLLVHLREARQQARARVEEFHATQQALTRSRGDSDSDDEHDPEGSTIAWDQALLAASRDAARRHLRDIESALSRVEDGWDGTCTGCGQPIPAERLQVRPHTDQCVSCASTRQR